MGGENKTKKQQHRHHPFLKFSETARRRRKKEKEMRPSFLDFFDPTGTGVCCISGDNIEYGSDEDMMTSLGAEDDGDEQGEFVMDDSHHQSVVASAFEKIWNCGLNTSKKEHLSVAEEGVLASVNTQLLNHHLFVIVVLVSVVSSSFVLAGIFYAHFHHEESGEA